MRPYCVDSVIDGDGLTVFKNEPESIRTVISEDTCAIMNDYLLSVVSTAREKAAVAGYEIAGKSGTGEQGDRAQDEYTITFIGYFPRTIPKRLCSLSWTNRRNTRTGDYRRPGIPEERLKKYSNIWERSQKRMILQRQSCPI